MLQTKTAPLRISPEQARVLRVAHPNLYAALSHDFEIPPGWYTLVFNLSEKVEKQILRLVNRAPFHAVGVRQTSAGLEFHMSKSWPKLTELIESHCLLAEKICEVCGKPGELVYSPAEGKTEWTQRVCQKHFDEFTRETDNDLNV